MGTIHADIELINADDLALARRNKLDKEEVKHMTVKMLVDTGAKKVMAVAEEIFKRIAPYLSTQ